MGIDNRNISKCLHPIDILPLIVNLVGEKSKLEFAFYEYRKEKQEDNRRIVTVTAEKAKDIFYSEIYPMSVRDNLEVALQSRVWKSEKTYCHLLMADLVGHLPGTSKNRLEKLYYELGASDIFFFQSGKSFHSYGIGTIPVSEFPIVNGKYLTLRNEFGNRIVDDRWVGHRLIAGYWALRLTTIRKKYSRNPIMLNQSKLLSET